MKLRIVCTFVSAGLLAGCSAVFAPEPLGDKAVVLDPGWSGTWMADDGVVTTTVTDSEKGLLQIAWLEAKPEGIELESYQVLMRSKGDAVFANIRDEESEHGYHWLLIDRKSNRHVLAWFPEAEQFSALIGKEEFPGKILYPDDENRDDVVLGELEQEHFDRITDPASGLLDWKSPVVLIKISE